jgi:hypothetical protein
MAGMTIPRHYYGALLMTGALLVAFAWEDSLGRLAAVVVYFALGLAIHRLFALLQKPRNP